MCHIDFLHTNFTKGCEINISYIIGYFLCGFCDELWQFYIAFGLIFLQHAKYGVIRSLASKCVHREEIGKILSAFALIAAIVPMIALPAVQTFYNKTLDIFPAAEVLLTASIVLVATFLNFLIYTQRWRISAFNSHYEDDAKATPSIDTVYSKTNYQLHQF